MLHLRNSFRFNGQPQWFDFYNCRVILPDQGLFFFIMPYVLSGKEVAGERAGLYVYGGNGGATGRSSVEVESIGPDGWAASPTNGNFQWEKSGSADNVFSDTEIRATGPSSAS